jgi:hypothetical protein
MTLEPAGRGRARQTQPSVCLRADWAQLGWGCSGLELDWTQLAGLQLAGRLVSWWVFNGARRLG